MLRSKGVKAGDGISECSCCPYMLPGKSSQACLWKISKEAALSTIWWDERVTLTAEWSNRSVDGLDKDTLSMDLCCCI